MKAEKWGEEEGAMKAEKGGGGGSNEGRGGEEEGAMKAEKEGRRREQ